MIELDKIYNQDCLEGMKLIDDKSIDLIVCDLPYGTTKNSWDVKIPLDLLWEEYKRIIKYNGAIVLFSQMPFTAVLAASNLKMFKYEIVWEKSNSTGFLNANFAPLKKHENILVFSKASAAFTRHKDKAMIYNPQFSKGKPYVLTRTGKSFSDNYNKKYMKAVSTINTDGRRYPIDIVKFNYDKEKFHPTQKPVALVEYLIKTYSNTGGVVLDNCIGSGTTAVACVNTNRRFIGFEINAKYFNIACNRVKDAQADKEMDLFRRCKNE